MRKTAPFLPTKGFAQALAPPWRSVVPRPVTMTIALLLTGLLCFALFFKATDRLDTL